MSASKGKRSRITVRLPTALLQLLVVEAELRGISVNDVIVMDLMKTQLQPEAGAASPMGRPLQSAQNTLLSE